jgi:hypothetical protein
MRIRDDEELALARHGLHGRQSGSFGDSLCSLAGDRLPSSVHSSAPVKQTTAPAGNTAVSGSSRTDAIADRSTSRASAINDRS